MKTGLFRIVDNRDNGDWLGNGFHRLTPLDRKGWLVVHLELPIITRTFGVPPLTCNLSLDIDFVFKAALLSFLSGQYFVKLLLFDFST